MTKLRLILNKTHYVQKRELNPSDFIKRWSLCHDLACVVKYIARAGQNDLKSTDLQMAEWHLLKKITEEQEQLSKKLAANSNMYDPPFIESMRNCPFPMMAKAVAKEWGLSHHLREVLFYITVFQNLYHRFPYMRAVLLKQALRHLRQEINAHHESTNATTD